MCMIDSTAGRLTRTALRPQKSQQSATALLWRTSLTQTERVHQPSAESTRCGRFDELSVPPGISTPVTAPATYVRVLGLQLYAVNRVASAGQSNLITSTVFPQTTIEPAVESCSVLPPAAEAPRPGYMACGGRRQKRCGLLRLCLARVQQVWPPMAPHQQIKLAFICKYL
jgi:hypothetical protein